MADTTRTQTNTISFGSETNWGSTELALSKPDALNMQILQSTVDHASGELQHHGGQSLPGTAPVSPTAPSALPSSAALPPAFSGLGLSQGTLAGLSHVATGMGFTAAMASASAATFGKQGTAESIVQTLAGGGGHSAASAFPVERLADSLPFLKGGTDTSGLPVSAEFQQLMASLTDPAHAMNQIQNLLPPNVTLDNGANALDIQTAIDALTTQLTMLNQVFDPLMDNLNGEVQSAAGQLMLSSGEQLSEFIQSSAVDLTNGLSNLLGPDAQLNPLIGNLMDVGSTVDQVVSIIGGLPDVIQLPGLEPVAGVIDGILTPVTDILNPVLDPVTGVLDPVTDILNPVTDILNPVTDVLNPVLEPVTGVLDPVTDVLNPVLDPVLDPIDGLLGGVLGGGLPGGDSSSSGDLGGGLADIGGSLASGISSGAGDLTQGLTGLLDGLGHPK